MTYQRLCDIMEKSNFLLDSSNEYDMEILHVLERQIPKPAVKNKNLQEICPDCGMVVINQKYCANCGIQIERGDLQ